MPHAGASRPSPGRGLGLAEVETAGLKLTVKDGPGVTHLIGAEHNKAAAPWLPGPSPRVGGPCWEGRVTAKDTKEPRDRAADQ